MTRGELVEALLLALGEEKPQRPAQRPRSLDHSPTYRRLLEPFALDDHEVRPGAAYNGRALVLPYVDWHRYQARLDEVAGPSGWGVEFQYYSESVVRCRLSILGVVREDIGEAEEEGGEGAKRKGANPVFGGVAQSFRRACAAFGLGRYLYALPPFFAPLEGGGKRFADKPGKLIEELFREGGLLPAARLEGEIRRAQSMEDLEYLRGALNRAAASGDILPQERATLKPLWEKTQERITAAFMKGEEPPAPAPRARAPQPPAPPEGRGEVERELSPQAKDTPAPEWAGQGAGPWKGKGSPGGEAMRPDLAQPSRASSPAPSSPEERQRKAQEALANAKVVRSAAPSPAAPASDPEGKPIANTPSARAARWIADLEGIKSFQDHAAFNETILKEHAKSQFDATDWRLLEEAAAERYKLLQRKERLLTQDPAF